MEKLELIVDGERFLVELKSPIGRCTNVCVNGEELLVDIPDWQSAPEHWHWFESNQRSFELDIDPELRWIRTVDGLHRIEVVNSGSAALRSYGFDGRVKSPIPGFISKVFVSDGQSVDEGQRLFILEAMKMENEICAPKRGIVSSLAAFAGKSALLGEVLLIIE